MLLQHILLKMALLYNSNICICQIYVKLQEDCLPSILRANMPSGVWDLWAVECQCCRVVSEAARLDYGFTPFFRYTVHILL